MLKKTEKESLIQEVKALIDQNSIMLVVKQSGINSAESYNLRSEIKKTESTYKVVKNTLVKVALCGTEFEPLKDSLTGQTAVVFSSSPVEVTKALADFSKKASGKLEVVSGFYEGKLLSSSDIKFLSSLPPLDVLRAQFIALIKAPSQKVYSCVKAPAEQLTRVIKAYSEK